MKLNTMSLTCEGYIAQIAICNPPVNTITPQFIDDLEHIFDALYDMDNVRCVVLSSDIKGIFVAGADINQFVTWKRADGEAVTRRGHDVLLKLVRFPKPVICAINGIAFGGGLELALACDIRIIAPGAKVGLPETGLGIVPGYGGTQRLPRLVGSGMAKKLIMTGKPISGEEAYRIGLAEVLSEPNASLDAALTLARQICANAPQAITAAKQCVDNFWPNAQEYGIDFEITAVGMLAETEDKTEGANAFLEKRKPVFSNR